ncbi:MAG: nitrate- and nitrite sensing domain-containing protein [Kibdelosporangium sp.]
MTGRRSWSAAAMQWRNWPVLVKIGAVLVVPVIAAMTLGTLRVQADVELADSYARVERLAVLRAELVPLLSAVQRERNFAVQPPVDAFQQQAGGTDTLIDTLRWLKDQALDMDPVAVDGYHKLIDELASLRDVRQQVVSGADSEAVLSQYASIVQAILDFDRALVSRFPDQELTGASAALYDLQMAREQVALQQAVVLVGIRRGELSGPERERLIEADVRLADMITDARAVAPPFIWKQYLDTVTGSDVATRQDLVRQARAEVQPGQRRANTKPTMPFAAKEWNSTSDATTGLMAFVAAGAASELQAASGRLQDDSGNRAGTQSVLLLAMVLLAAAIGGVVGRYLLRSLNSLRTAALDVASHQLPAVVADIRAGKPAAIAPMPVRTTEEFGQLARAFDTVQNQAVKSAEEEAALRGNLRNIFVNLSRRSQSLVERQLRLMEQLEQKENDPDQLANLFKLDHLATRMRRNNENLVVLSGADLGRRFSEHVPLSDVLRAAVSEVEHYERAVVRSVPRIEVLGYAAGDLVRTIAELVENATAFSPPDSQVIIHGERRENGSVLLEIIDDGIGMADAELAEANSRVAAAGGVDVPVSRQMGLFVVGSLANRHGISVVLARREGKQDGLIASVVVPSDLIYASAIKPAEQQDIAPVREGVAGRLQSLGIKVSLPRLPWASSPASILFMSKDLPAEGAPAPGRTATVRTTAAPMVAQPTVTLPAVTQTAVAQTAATQTAVTQAAAPQAEPAQDFAWLGGPAPSAPAQQPLPRQARPFVNNAPQKEGELPKRVPKAQLFAGSVKGPGKSSGNGAGNGSAKRSAAPPGGPGNAERARGFLSSFQAGVRQSKEADQGEEKP